MADYGPAGDLAFAEVAQRLVGAVPNATIVATTVGPFDTLAAGFVVAQLALTQSPGERMVFHNVAPRRDEATPRRVNEGERFTAAEAPNGTLVVGPKSGYSLAFLHDQAPLFYLDVPVAGSQFRSRDFLPAAAGRLVAGERRDIGEPIPAELVPRVPPCVVAYTDGYGNLKTTLDERPAANGERVLVRVGDASATAIVSDGSFSVAEGELALAPGSSGWPLRDGGERHFLELVLRGGSASGRLGHPASGTPVDVTRIAASPYPADELLFTRVEDFLAGLQAAKRSEHTIAAYRDDLLGVAARIAVALHGPDASVQRLCVSELDGRVMRQAFAAWASDHAAASMVRVWGTFNRFFAYLIDDEVLDRNPMKAVPKPKLAATAPRAIRQENVAETLLAAAATPDPRAKLSKRWPELDVALVALYCVTGIRLAEGIALRLDSITGPSGARRLQVTGKGKKERMIPLQPGLESVLERYLHSCQERHGSDILTDPAAALLVHYDNTSLTRGRVQYVIEQLYRRAGLTAAVPAGALAHALRHSFASLAIEYGTDVAELRELLGHPSLATTSRYLDANTSRLRHAVAANPSQRALDQHR